MASDSHPVDENGMGEARAAGYPAAASRLRLTIFLMGVAAFAGAATTRITDAVLPQMAEELHVTIGTVSQVATAYAFAYGFFQVFFGPLGDRYGKIRIVLIACVGSMFTTLACAQASSLTGISVARFFSGLTAAAIVPMSLAWIGDMIPPEERQAVLAKFMSGQIMGLLAGQVGGGVLGELFGWRAGFYLLSGIYLVALCGLVFELTFNRAALAGPQQTGGTSWGRIFVLARRPKVQFILLAVSIEAFAMFGAFTYVGANLRERFNLDFATVGLFLSCYCIGGLTFVLFSRRLIRRFGPAGMGFGGTLLIGSSYILMAFTQWELSFVPIIGVMGLGFYMLHNTLQSAATQMAPDARGTAVAMFATCFFLSQAVGVALAGNVIDRWGIVPVFLTAAVILIALGFLLNRRFRLDA